MTQEQKIDQRIFDLYDEYCHGRLRIEATEGEPLTVGY